MARTGELSGKPLPIPALRGSHTDLHVIGSESLGESLFPVRSRRTILVAVSESCCSPAKENRLTGAKVIGAWTQHSSANLSRIYDISKLFSGVEKDAGQQRGVGRKHRRF